MIAYTAGFFDAEGSVWVGKGGTAVIMRAQFAQKDPTILNILREYWQLSARVNNDKLIFNGQHAELLYSHIAELLAVKHYEVTHARELINFKHTRTKEETCRLWQSRIRDKTRMLPLIGDELDQYAAGFLDGDGYISKRDIHIRISQKHVNPLQTFKDNYNGQIVQRNDGMYQWTVWNNQAKMFLARIKPYLLSPRHEFF